MWFSVSHLFQCRTVWENSNVPLITDQHALQSLPCRKTLLHDQSIQSIGLSFWHLAQSIPRLNVTRAHNTHFHQAIQTDLISKLEVGSRSKVGANKQRGADQKYPKKYRNTPKWGCSVAASSYRWNELESSRLSWNWNHLELTQWSHWLNWINFKWRWRRRRRRRTGHC